MGDQDYKMCSGACMVVIVSRSVFTQINNIDKAVKGTYGFIYYR